MVKITNIGNKYRILRTRAGNVIGWNPGDTVEVEDEHLLRQFETSKHFKVEDGVNAKDIGGGVKTHVKSPKRRGRPPKSKKATIQEKVDKALKKKPKKGLKKAKKERAD